LRTSYGFRGRGNGLHRYRRTAGLQHPQRLPQVLYPCGPLGGELLGYLCSVPVLGDLGLQFDHS